MRLVVGSHNMDGRPWDASRLATWLHPTGALDAADEPSPRGADVVCVALQDADEGAVGALAAFFELDVVAARRAGALRVVVRAPPAGVSCRDRASADPGADPERHGCLGARVDVLGVSGRHAASLAFVCCHLPPGEARAARRSRARDCARDLGDDFFDGCDHVLFAGDLNYRLCATSSKMRTRADAVEAFRALAAAGGFASCRARRARPERAAGRCFAGFDAVDVGAASPTVAYAGAPAYADRVLWRSRPGGAPPERSRGLAAARRRLAPRAQPLPDGRARRRPTPRAAPSRSRCSRRRCPDDDDDDDDDARTVVGDDVLVGRAEFDAAEFPPTSGRRSARRSSRTASSSAACAASRCEAAGAASTRFDDGDDGALAAATPRTLKLATEAGLLYDRVDAEPRAQAARADARRRARAGHLGARSLARTKRALARPAPVVLERASFADAALAAAKQAKRASAAPGAPATPEAAKHAETADTPTNFLRSIPVFQGFSEPQLARVHEALLVRDYAPDEVIIRQGDDRGEEFYIIVRGRVRVFVEKPAKAAASNSTRAAAAFFPAAEAPAYGKQVAVLSSGDYFGERAMILNEPRASTCVADAEAGVSCLTLDRESFEEAVMDRGHKARLKAGKSHKRALGESPTADAAKTMRAQFRGYEHDANEEATNLLVEYITQYADLLPRTSRGGGETEEDRVAAGATWAGLVRDVAVGGAIVKEDGALGAPVFEARADDDAKKVIAIVALRDPAPFTVLQELALLQLAAEVTRVLRAKHAEFQFLKGAETFVASAIVERPPDISLSAVRVFPPLDEDHVDYEEAADEPEANGAAPKKKKKKKKKKRLPKHGAGDRSELSGSDAGARLYRFLASQADHRVFARVVLMHGVEELTVPWDSKPALLKKVRKDRGSLPPDEANGESPKKGLPVYVADFSTKDGGAPKPTFVEAARGMHFTRGTELTLRDLPRATVVKVSLHGADGASLAFCKTPLWNAHNVLKAERVKLPMARGDAAIYARREKVLGPRYRSGKAACAVDLDHGGVDGAPSEKLASRAGEASYLAAKHRASKQLKGKFDGDLSRLLAEHVMHALTEDECRLLWAKREVLASNPKALPKFLLTVNWGNHDDVREGYRLLKTWAPMPPLEALQLLSVRFPDPKVRSYAVRCMNALPDAELAAVMLQLAQVVKFERSHDTALNRFLLRRALRNPSVCGHALYWSLATEKDVNDEHHCCRVLFDLYNRRCGEYRLTLGHQALLVTKLAQITETVKQMKGSSDRDRDDVLRRELEGVVLPRAFQLPLSPFMVCRGLDLAKCKVMGSAQKPLWLTFHNAVRAAPPHVVIFKCGDDLRQDQLTLQIIRSMDALWTEAGLELRMSPYGCVATAGAQGFIEVVQQANTLANITKDERFRSAGAKPRTRASRKYGAAHEAYYGTGAVAAWLARECAAYAAERLEADTPWLLKPSEEANPLAEGAALHDALDNFARSLAGYCVATYVLGIGDRHNDNIMLTRDGRYFHIDFGHFLGNFKKKFGVKRESAPFVLTPHMETAFLVLRRHRDHIMVLLMLMVDCGIPELAKIEDVTWVHGSLMFDEPDDDAAVSGVMALIDASLNNKRTRTMHAIHSCTRPRG
ncbi:phosphatidylinositol kinase [Aureococcus anophagefferens]|nr:phosphatidylinositol kinase [Aureococcus anophagefferens]